MPTSPASVGFTSGLGADPFSNDVKQPRAHAHTIRKRTALWPTVPKSPQLATVNSRAPAHVLAATDDIKARAISEKLPVFDGYRFG